MNSDEISTRLRQLQNSLEDVRAQLAKTHELLHDLERFFASHQFSSEGFGMDLGFWRSKLSAIQIDDQRVRSFGRYRLSMENRLANGKALLQRRDAENESISSRIFVRQSEINRLEDEERLLLRQIDQLREDLNRARRIEAMNVA